MMDYIEVTNLSALERHQRVSEHHVLLPMINECQQHQKETGCLIGEITRFREFTYLPLPY